MVSVLVMVMLGVYLGRMKVSGSNWARQNSRGLHYGGLNQGWSV